MSEESPLSATFLKVMKRCTQYAPDHTVNPFRKNRNRHNRTWISPKMLHTATIKTWNIWLLYTPDITWLTMNLDVSLFQSNQNRLNDLDLHRASTMVLKKVSSSFCWRFTMAWAKSRKGLVVTKSCSILNSSPRRISSCCQSLPFLQFSLAAT